MVRDRRRAQAPARSRPQPRVDGAGLRRPRERNVRGSDPGPGKRGLSRRDGRSGEDRPGRECPVRSTAFAVRGCRELPAAAGGRELHSAPGDADCHRGQDRVRTPLLQHQRPRLQHRAAVVPAQCDRRTVWLQGGGFFAVDEGDRAVPQVSFPAARPPPRSLPSAIPEVGFRQQVAPRARRQPAGRQRPIRPATRVKRTGPT